MWSQHEVGHDRISTMQAINRWQEHTDSYYAATRNYDSEYPQLQGEVETEICIIGGGFTGVATALTLSERGHKVLILEQNRIGWGASGRNGGQLIHGIGGASLLARHLHEETIWRLHYRGNEIIRDRVKTYDIDCNLKLGYIDVAYKQSQLDDLFRDYVDHEKRGLCRNLQMLNRDEVRKVLGTDRYVGGMINNKNGHLHPLNLCAGEAEAAAGLGALIFERSQVVEFTRGAKVKIGTERGSVMADKLLIAGNAYHHLEPKSLSGLVFPAGSFIIATEQLDDALVEEINPRDMAVCDMNHVLDYFRLSADKRMLFGGRCNYSGRVPSSIENSMLPRMLKVYPQLKGKRIDYAWGGNIGIVIRRVPLLGRLSNNIFYAMGYSGHGVAPTHIAAEVISNAMEGDTAILEAYEKIKHVRVPFGQWFGNQIVALGMLYFRALDLL